MKSAAQKITLAILGLLLFAAAGIYLDRSVKINLGGVSSGALGDYGAAPDFPAGDTWINSSPLSIAGLKGKVVLVDFWTYSCINCIRTLPYLTKWYGEYKNDGLVIVGVHTPEFSFEQESDNVRKAVAQFGISYPVVQDNDYAIWNSYDNEYWPAEYLIDQNGEIVEEHFGEGDYDKTENDIRSLLGLPASTTLAASGDDLDQIGSPEMYFGTDRLENLDPAETPSSAPADFSANRDVALNAFSLGGRWQFNGGDAVLTSPTGEIVLKFHSAKLYMVASSQTPATLSVSVDGKALPAIQVGDAKLYTLFDSGDYADHLADIVISGAGFTAFTFTFG